MGSDSHIFERVYARMDTELPDHLTYHNRHHTEYVVRLADIIALEEGCNPAERRLIAFAALFHDAGFLIGPEKHEERSCAIAREELRELDLPGEDLDHICNMILATRIPQRPVTLPEKIVADADLYYLGTDLYDLISNKLYQELKFFDPNLTDGKWLDIQINFLTAHQYHTDFARKNLELKKNLHRSELQQMK